MVQVKDPYGETVTDYTNSYALLIGASEYSDPAWPDLESIPGELGSVERVLTKQGFIVEKHLNPNGRELRGHFNEFIGRYGYDESNRLLFYFAGHGYTRQSGNKGYLVPVDAPSPEGDLQGFLRKSLPMTQVLAYARGSEAKHSLFLFDSCFSGTVFKSRALPKKPPHISQMTALPVRQFITAGGAGETVPAKSTFTMAFVDALEYGVGDLNQDGYISGTELGLYLQAEVPKYVRQTPQYGKIQDYELSRGDFVFVLPTAGDAVSVSESLDQQIAEEQAQLDRLQQQQRVEEEREKRERLEAIRAQKEELEQRKREKRVDQGLIPSMVTIPGGTFRMGDLTGNGSDDEKPAHRVRIKPFRMGKTELPFTLYDRYLKATNQKASDERYKHASDHGWGRGDRPAINVSWEDAQAFIQWLNETTQPEKPYRLPTEAEWEYAARGGTETDYWWGNSIGSNNANCSGCGSQWDGKTTAPTASFQPNPYGLYDTVGNVWEWVEDCYREDYNNAPSDGSAVAGSGCFRVFRGGSWDYIPLFTRVSYRGRYWSNYRINFLGFRLAQDL